MKTTAELSFIEMDIAKTVFQVHRVNPQTGEIQRIKLRRDHALSFFAQCAPALLAMEACGGAHH